MLYSYNCYCPPGYQGYLNNGGQLPSPDYFSTLPWELQLIILKQALGPNIPKSLAQLELVSSQ
jgi:hypothetical protein